MDLSFWLLAALFLQFLSFRYAVNELSIHQPQQQPETRQLVIVYCETRGDVPRHFLKLSFWNATKWKYEASGLEFVNVCKGADWKPYRFFTKVVQTTKYFKALKANLTRDGLDAEEILLKLHVLLVDTDIMWNSAMRGLSLIWKHYDLARHGKHLVVSSGTSCWIGHPCNVKDTIKFFHNSSTFRSISPFLNAGVVMGRVDKLLAAYEYVLAHNTSYVAKSQYGWSNGVLDDQFALTDYATRVSPEEVSIDTTQYLSGTLIFMRPKRNQSLVKEQWTCYELTTRTLYHHNCTDYLEEIFHTGHFQLDELCLWKRVIPSNSSFAKDLDTLEASPLLWHGNGMTKTRLWQMYHRVQECMKSRRLL